MVQLPAEVTQLAREAIAAAERVDGDAVRTLAKLLGAYVTRGDGEPREERWDELCGEAIDEHELVGNALNAVVCAVCHVLEGAQGEPTYGAHVRGARGYLDALARR